MTRHYDGFRAPAGSSGEQAEPAGPTGPDRRSFLSTSGRLAGAGWLAAHLPLASLLAACARDAAERGEPFVTLSTTEGEAMGALAEAILPGGELPGAREAGAVHFVDRALDELFPQFLELIRTGLADLEARAEARDGAPGSQGARFAALTPEARTQVVHEVEEEPFFQVARLLVVMGTLSDPTYGGNRDGAGWALLGMEHAPTWEPPFGHYDEGYRGDGVQGDDGTGADGAGADGAGAPPAGTGS